MKRNPYFYKMADDGNSFELYFHTGEDAELIEHFDSCRDVSKAERVANDAYNRGVLSQLRKRKHELNLENQKLYELLELMG